MDGLLTFRVQQWAAICFISLKVRRKAQQATVGRSPNTGGPNVAANVARFCQQKKFCPERTYGVVFAEKVTELSGDEVTLDETEELLVAMKRNKAISGRRLVSLLGRHQREVRDPSL